VSLLVLTRSKSSLIRGLEVTISFSVCLSMGIWVMTTLLKNCMGICSWDCVCSFCI
jgi:hypothetical protein